jgi:hypothetical protein
MPLTKPLVPARMITADALRGLPQSKVKDIFDQLGPQKTEELKHDWNFWARDNQLEPEIKTGTLGSSMLVVGSVRPALVLSG